jgi:hypothetical protein
MLKVLCSVLAECCLLDGSPLVACLQLRAYADIVANRPMLS